MKKEKKINLGVFSVGEHFQSQEDLLASLANIPNRVTSDFIVRTLKAHEPREQAMMKLYERYKASTAGTPILQRTFQQPNKVNNKLNNPFMSSIIDTKVGYFAGKPFVYDLDEADYAGKEGLYALHDKTIKAFNQRSSVKKLDAETVKMASICGYSVRLLYIDHKGKECMTNVHPWEVIFINDYTTGEPELGIRHYPVEVESAKGVRKATRVEVYDYTNITYYLENEQGNYELDSTVPMNPRPHMFDDIPLIKFKNNEEEMGDVERVLNLIDAYDRSISDLNSEIEQLRLAYMIFKGYEPDEETLERAKQIGAFGIDSTDGSDITFLTKDINSGAIEVHLDRLEKNILRFADSVDLTDESFGGNLSGIAIKYKLFGLESKCGTLEMHYQASLQKLYEVVATAWAKKGVEIDASNIFCTFVRNLPVNVAEEIESNVKLKGLVSEKTRLSLLPVVDDVQYELDQMERERKGEQSEE